MIGCGGHSGNVPSVALIGSAPEGTALGYELMPAVSGGNPRRVVDYSYDYSMFSCSEGFSVVPMLFETVPDISKADAMSITSDNLGRDRRVNIDCTPISGFNVHFRYDPSIWQVDGVGVLNPYPEGTGYISFVRILEPGLLLIATEPVGAGSSIASGHVAEIVMQPLGAERSISAASSGTSVMTMAIFCQGLTAPPPIKTAGNINCRLDGEFGDKEAPEKDGVLDDGNELSSYVWDNCTHDVELTNFSQTYGWNSGNADYDDYDAMDLSWTERLVGDYNNDGLVAISDLTPVTHLFDGPMEINQYTPVPPQRAQSHTIEQGNTEHGTFFEMMRDTRTKLEGGWLWGQAHIVESYYILDQADAPAEGNYQFNSDTPKKNAVDCFWDGLVRDYCNWDSDLNGIADAYYHYPSIPMPGGNPVPTWSVPGDSLAVNYHFDEIVSGFKAWTVLSSEADSFDPENPPPSAMLVFDRERDDYDDKPWLLSGSDSYRRANLLAELDSVDCFEIDALGGTTGTFDVVIAPFALPSGMGGGGGELEYGVMTRLRDVMTAVPASYGPQYVDGLQPTDDSTDLGLQNVVGRLSLTFTYNNADAIDVWHRFNNEQVYYQLYGSEVEANVWTNPLKELWAEGTIDAVAGLGQRSVTFTFDPIESGINFDVDWNHIYFGIRCVDALGNVIEYDNPADSWDPNESVFDYIVSGTQVFGPQYKINGDEYDGSNPDAHPFRGIISATQLASPGVYDEFEIAYYSADQVANELGSPAWDTTNVVYHLYVSVDPDPGQLYNSSNEVGYWDETADTDLGNETRFYLASDINLGAGTYYFGVRAYNATGQALIEYSDFDDPNISSVTCLTNDDVEPPYFVEYTSPYDQTAPPADISVVTTYPMTGQFQVMMKRAIDPPKYNPDTSIKYLCFYSTLSFTAESTSGYDEASQLPPGLNVKVQWLDLTSHIGSPMDSEAYSFWIDEDNGGPINPNDDYFVYVAAEDAGGNRSINSVVESGAHARRQYQDHVVLVTGSSDGEIRSTGDIQADSSNVYLIYAFDKYSPALAHCCKLRYQELPQGDYYQTQTFEDLLSPYSFRAASGDPTSAPQIQLDFSRDSAGQPVQGSDKKMALFSITAVDSTYGSFPYNAYAGFSAWNNTYQQWQQPVIMTHDSGVDFYCHTGDASAITNYQFFNASSELTNEYFMPWAHIGYRLELGGWYYGVLVYNRTINGSWNTDSIEAPDSGIYNSSCFGTSNSPDIITRTLGLNVDQYFPLEGSPLPGLIGYNKEDFIRVGNPAGNMLYILGNSGNNILDVYEDHFVTSDLYYTSNIEAGLNGPIDLATVIPDLAMTQNPTIGPNSMEVVRSDNAGVYWIYIVYSNAEDGSGDDQDNAGLRIAVASQFGAGSIAGFESGGSAGLIDDSFLFTNGQVMRYNDVVDLRVKPGGKIAVDKYEKLGCVYVSRGSRLCLKETVDYGGSYGWEGVYQWPEPDIDEGKISWAKLAYLDDEIAGRAIPYVLYCVQDRVVGGSPFDEIRLWRLGGW